MHRALTQRIAIPIITLALVLLAPWVAPRETAHAAASVHTFYVPDDFVTIQAALDAAADLYTIVVRDGVYTGPDNKNLDFRGKAIALRSENGPENCIIDCEGDGRGLYFHSGETSTSVVDGFAIIDGYSFGGGGGIYCVYASPIITNCVISGGSADTGGGICLHEASPIISNCTIMGNSARHGGGIMCYSFSDPDIINCLVTNNSALSEESPAHLQGQGGGIYSDHSSPTIIGCTITNNYAARSGGGINYFFRWSFSPLVSDCIIAGNSAGSNGGGIISQNCSLVLTNCIITGNSADEFSGGGIYVTHATDVSITNCTIADNQSWTRGGGIFADEGSSLILTNSILWQNRSHTGPQIMIPSTIYPEDSVALTISYSDIEGGQAGVDVGPGNDLIWDSGNIDNDPLFADPGYWNEDEWHDGDYHLTYGSPCIDAGTDAGTDSDIDGDSRPLDSGFDIGADEFVRVPNNCPSLDSENLDPAGGTNRSTLRFTVHYYDEDGDSPTVKNIVIDGVSHDMRLLSGSAADGFYYFDTQLDGGTHHYYFSFHDGTGCLGRLPSGGSFETPNITGLTFYVPEDYTAIQAALDDSINGDTIIVRNGVYTGAGNKNLDFRGKAIALRSENGPQNCTIDCEGNGRAFHFHEEEKSDSIVDGFTITNGYAGGVDTEGSGGGILCDKGSSPTISNCIIIGNSVNASGGGIACMDYCSPSIANCTISDNSAVSRGGGISCSQNSSPDITNCTISKNSASDGGGISFYYLCSGIITDCIISSNSAEKSGGGIHCYYDFGASITNCTLVGNSAGKSGGGISYSSYYSSEGPSIIENCVVSGNLAGEDGGGIAYSSKGPSIIENCVVSGNSAGKSGGGISYASYSSEGPSIIENCVVSGNLAGEDGGGIFLPGKNMLATIMNCAIIGNSAAYLGGGIECEYSPPEIENCTFSKNSAQDGGGIHSSASAIANVRNCIFSGDTATWGSEISLGGAGTIVVSYSDIHGGRNVVYAQQGTSLIVSDGNIDADPLFVAGPLGDYYLSHVAAGQVFNSPCINAGSDTAVNLGLDSFTTRIDQIGDTGIVDMGYHYPIVGIGKLTQITLESPMNESLVSSPPTFVWTSDDGTSNAFVVEVALSLSGPIYTSSLTRYTHWTMSQSAWDMIPSGSFVYWRVVGADLDRTPPNVVYSDQIWWFYKP